MGSPRHVCNRRRRTREGPDPACVRSPLKVVVAHAGGEGWINILPWYRPVGVAKTSSETQRRKSRAAREGKWPPRGTGTTVRTSPGSAPGGTGKAGENGQNSGEVGGSSAWTRPSAPECGDTLKGSSGRPASDLGWGSSREDGSGVAIDWVTGRSYSSARRRLNVQSGQRKGGKCGCAPLPERCRPWSWTLKRCCGKRMGPDEMWHRGRVSASGGKVFAPGCASRTGWWEPGGARRTQAIISRLPGCDGQAADAVSAYTQVKMKDAHKLSKIPKSECPDIWIRLPRHKWPKIMVQYGRPVVPLERNLYGHPLAGLLWERRFEKILLKYCWEVLNWECLSLYLDDIKMVGKKQKPWSDVEITQQRSRFGRTNILPWSWRSGMYSETMWNMQRYCRQLQNHVRIANFSGEGNRKTSFPSKSSYFFMVLWHGWSCKEVCGTILWVGKQDDSTTPQSIYSMRRWPPLQRTRNEICWRIVTSMLPNCSEMFVLGTYWKTWYSMVREQTCTINHRMDQSIWQTPESIDFIFSSYMWIQTMLWCG